MREELHRGARRRIAVAGLGAIGFEVAQALDKGVAGCELVAVSARDRADAAKRISGFSRPVPVVALIALEPLADIVVECAPPSLLPEIAGPFLRTGKMAVVLSVGALLAADYLLDLARAGGGQIAIPSGAILGLDAVTAAVEGTIHTVHLVSRKPPRALAGAPFLSQHRIRIEDLKKPLRVFTGTVREAAAGFPTNLNVAVALALAGIGPDRTVLEVWADPTINRNLHHITVEADSARFSMSIENVPTANPKTGRITAHSIVALLRKLDAPLRVGT